MIAEPAERAPSREEATTMGATVSRIRPGAGSAAPDLSAFAGRYLSITTFRRDGTEVATPVWFVRDVDRLLVQTDASSGKVRRLRRDPRALIAICKAWGTVTGPKAEALVEILPDLERTRAERLIRRKYRFDMIIFRPLRAIQRAFHVGPAQEAPLILAVTLAPAAVVAPEHEEQLAA
jgi:PPOX class probable F420-dependent enzyme